MKNFVFIFLLINSQFLFCQEKIVQQRTMKVDELEIVTYGLDDIIIENSEGNNLEITLFDENPYAHNILFTEEDGVLKLTFELNFNPFKEEVFRKYITKRLEKARVLIKIPKHKMVVVYGKTIGVTSKSYDGNLSVYIEKGNIQLNTIKNTTIAHLFLGNVYARALNSELNLTTKKGRIVINEKNEKSPFVNSVFKTSKKLTVSSIHANITVVTD